MKYNRKFLSALLVLLGVLFSCTQAPQQIAKQNITSVSSLALEKGEGSTVQIRLVRASGKLAHIGSGFFVARDKIATNFHNVATKNLVFAKITGKETILEVEGVTAFDVEHDLVILKVSGAGVPFSLGDSDTVEVGEPVSTLGYPETKYRVTAGIVHGISDNRKEFRVKAEYVGGMSGGPVLNSKREVIGVAAASTGIYGIAAASNVLKLLLAQSDSIESLKQFRKRYLVRAYTHVMRGRREIFRGDYIGAIGAFDKAIDLYPEGADIFYGYRGWAKWLLGESKEAKGNRKEAQNCYNEAMSDLNKDIELSPDDSGLPEAYRFGGYAKTKFGEFEDTKGNADEALGYYNQAIAHFNEAVKLNPEYAGAYSNRGYTKIRLAQSEVTQGNVDKARIHYQTAIEDCTKAIKLSSEYAEDSLMRVYAKYRLEPENVDTYKNRGDAQLYLAKLKTAQNNMDQAESHYRAAIEDYTEAIRLKSDYADAYYNRGLAKQGLGLQEEAKDNFQKAAELNSEIEGPRGN